MPDHFDVLQNIPLTLAGGAIITAVAPTDEDGEFILVLGGGGNKPLVIHNFCTGTSRRIKYEGSVDGSFGAHFFRPKRWDRSVVFLSVAESKSRWCCLKIEEGGSVAEAVQVITLPANLAAPVSAASGDHQVALCTADGAVHLICARTGAMLASNSLGLVVSASKFCSLVRLDTGRYALLYGLEFFVLTMEKRADVWECSLLHRGSLRGVSDNIQSAIALGNAGNVLLRSSDGELATITFPFKATDTVDADCKQLTHRGIAQKSLAAWTYVPGGYVADWTSGEGGGLHLALHDMRFGMAMGNDVVENAPPRPVKACTAGKVSVLYGAGAALAVRWTLAKFSLSLVLGSSSRPCEVNGKGAGSVEDDSGALDLTPFWAAAASNYAPKGDGPKKRAQDLEDVTALFSSAKRRRRAERAIIAAVDSRQQPTTPSLLDIVLANECWTVAEAMLGLGDLDEGIAAKLLDARPELLRRFVCTSFTPSLLASALRRHLSQSSLMQVISTLVDWLEVWVGWSHEEVKTHVPNLPSHRKIFEFLALLVDGCLPEIARSCDADLQKRLAALVEHQRRQIEASQRLFGVVEATLQQRFSAEADDAVMDIWFLPL